MTRELGTDPANPAENKTCHLIQKGGVLQLVADFSIQSDRKIYGVAHVPVIDRENEIILADAIRKALPEYMKLPILHVQHTERPVGTVTKAFVDESGKLHIYADIKDTEDTNDVWSDIESGELNKFSIFGKRDDASPECALAPTQRISPCVTKALTLFSISVVGDNAMNQDTFLRVAKAYNERSDGMSEEEEKKKDEDEVEKCHDLKKDDGTEDDKKKEDEVEKSDVPELNHEPTNISAIMGRLDGIEKSVATLYEMASPVEKSEDEEDDKVDEKEKKEEEKVEKAVPPVEDVPKDEKKEQPDYVVKAALDGYVTKAELGTIQKAFDELKAKVEKMENETIEKGGHVVFISKAALEENPQIDNLSAIEGA